MSEPVSNVEIEDVLSSIRRLVSNTDRGEKTTSDDSGSDTDKLVLTPSLRVDDDQASSVGEGVENKEIDAQDVGDLAALSSADFALEEENPAAEESASCADEAELDCGDEPQAADHEPQDAPTESAEAEFPSEDREAHQPAEVETADLDAETMPENAENAGQSDPDDVWDEVSESSAADSGPKEDEADSWNDLQAHAASFEKVVAARDDQWDPDGIADDENAASQVAPLPWVDHDETDSVDAVDQATDESQAADPFATATLHFRHQSHQATGDDAEGASVEAFNDTADDENSGNNEFLFKEAALAADEALLDEDALRDLVSEIVRQELQGALGERITRNVRKLVRREIHRALAAQEFD